MSGGGPGGRAFDQVSCRIEAIFACVALGFMIGADERLTSMSPAFRCLEAMQAEVRSAWTSVDGIEQFLVLVAPGVTAIRRLNDEAALRALSRAGEIYARRHELDARRWSYSAEKGQSFESGFPDLDKVLGKVGAIIGKMS